MSTPPTKHPVGVGRPLPSRPAPGKRPAAAAPHPVKATAPVVAPAPAVIEAPQAIPAPAPGNGARPAPQIAPAPAPVVVDHIDLEADNGDAPAPAPGLADGDVIDLTTGGLTNVDDEPTGLDGPTPAPVEVVALVAVEQVAPLPVVAPEELVPAAPVTNTRLPMTAPALLPTTQPTDTRVSTFVDTEEVWAAPAQKRDPINYIDDDDDGSDDDLVSGLPAFRPARSKRAVKLTPRDLRILQFLCRYRFATYAQLFTHFDTSYEVMRRRMPKLQREGLVKSMTYGATTFLLWRVTEAGAEMSGLNLSTPRKIASSTIRHDLGLVDLGIRFEAAGEMVVTEREIRAADTRNAVSDRMQVARTYGQGSRILTDEPVYAVAFGAGNGKQRGHMHIPDMVLVRPSKDGTPQSIAIELETQHKTPIRLREVLYAYKRASERNVGLVIFYTDKKAVRNLINQAANDTGTTGMVEIRKWTPAVESGALFKGE